MTDSLDLVEAAASAGEKHARDYIKPAFATSENYPPRPRPRPCSAGPSRKAPLAEATPNTFELGPLPHAESTPREDWNQRFVLGHGWQPSLADGDDGVDASRHYAERLERIAGTNLHGQLRVVREAAAERERRLRQELVHTTAELARLKRERKVALEMKESCSRLRKELDDERERAAAGEVERAELRAAHSISLKKLRRLTRELVRLRDAQAADELRRVVERRRRPVAPSARCEAHELELDAARAALGEARAAERDARRERDDARAENAELRSALLEARAELRTRAPMASISTGKAPDVFSEAPAPAHPAAPEMLAKL